MKSKAIAYMLWMPSIIGVAGLHRIYVGKIGTGLLWLFTLGLFGFGTLIDLFVLGTQVDEYNNRKNIKKLSKKVKKNGTA